MMDNMSIADAMALRNDNGFNGGFGGDFFLVILFLFLFGGNGFGQNGFGGAATAAAQNEILMGQQFDRVNQKQDAIAQGICDSTYALNASITGEGRAIQTQLAECCCNTQLLGKDIMTAIHAEGDATRAMMRENEIQTLRDKVNDLQRDAALCGVVRYPLAMTYASNCNPFCGNQNPCGGYGCGNGF